MILVVLNTPTRSGTSATFKLPNSHLHRTLTRHYCLTNDNGISETGLMYEMIKQSMQTRAEKPYSSSISYSRANLRVPTILVISNNWMPNRRKAVHGMKLSGPLMILLLQQHFNLLETPLILMARAELGNFYFLSLKKDPRVLRSKMFQTVTWKYVRTNSYLPQLHFGKFKVARNFL